MTEPNALSAFSISRQYPAQQPDRIQLYSLPTPNGVKVSIALEEMQLPYEVHLVSFETQDQLTPEFIGTFPNNKIPAIIDPHGPGGAPLALFESGAILIYLAEKTGSALLPADPVARYQTLQWLMFQMGGVGPMFGQLGFFHKYAGKELEDKRPRDRYLSESRRLLGVLQAHMADRQWMVGDSLSLADIAIWPWVRGMVSEAGYNAASLVGFEDFPALKRTLAAFEARPAVQRGLVVPARA